MARFLKNGGKIGKAEQSFLLISPCVYFASKFTPPLAIPAPNYYTIIVPALGLLVPFVIRWIENRSRLKQARHLLDVIKTRDEIEKMLQQAADMNLNLLQNEEDQLNYYQKELEKEIKRNRMIDIRLYPILISVELVFFISAIFSRAVSFLENLIYAQGKQNFSFLEGIFSNPNIRIGLLVFCLVLSIFITNGLQKKVEMRFKPSLRREILIFIIFNAILAAVMLFFGLILFLLDWLIPWF